MAVAGAGQVSDKDEDRHGPGPRGHHLGPALPQVPGERQAHECAAVWQLRPDLRLPGERQAAIQRSGRVRLAQVPKGQAAVHTARQGRHHQRPTGLAEVLRHVPCAG